MGSDGGQGNPNPTGYARIEPRARNVATPPGKARSAPLYMFFAVQGGNPAQWAGSRYLGLTSFQGQDSISSPFEYQLELHANSADGGGAGGTTDWPSVATETGDVWELDFDSIVGQSATVGLAQPSADWLGGAGGVTATDIDVYHQDFVPALTGDKPAENLSVFNGVIGSFTMAEPGVYHATLHPNLWLLTLSNGYGIVQGNFATAVGSVLQRHGMVPGSLGTDPVGAEYFIPANLSGDGSQDWLQAGESDYAFVQRLMGKFNVYYYFEHGPRGHRVVFSNIAQYAPVTGASSALPTTPAAGSTTPDSAVMRYVETSEDGLGLEERQVISFYSYQRSLSAACPSVNFVRPEATATVESVATYAQAVVPSDDASAAALEHGPPFNLHRVFADGALDIGNHGAAETQRTQQRAMLQGGRSKLSGKSNSALFRAGRWFEMSARAEMTPGGLGQSAPGLVRPSLAGKRFVLDSVKHQASIDGHYSNSFEAKELDALLTPFSLQATQQDTIMATVVDTPAGQSTYRAPNFLPKGAFAPNYRNSDSTGNGEHEQAQSVAGQAMLRGVYVTLCTDATSVVWVKLSNRMTTAPQVGALVSVGRARDECEMPEIQDVLDSHGSIAVKPVGEAGLRWQKNTSIGSNYSTSYGDSQSIRYGAQSPGASELAAAKAFVHKAYNDPKSLFDDGGVAIVSEETLGGGGSGAAPASGDGYEGGGLKDVSYSQGASFSYSESDAGPDGTLSRSISRGSDWSSRIGATSRNYSVTGKASARSGTPLEVKSFDGAATGSQNWVFGDSHNESVTAGNTYSVESVAGNTTSNSTVTGNTKSTNTVTGDTTSNSTVTGNTTSTSTVTKNVTDNTTVKGTQTSVRTMQDENSTATGRDQTNTSTYASTANHSTVTTSTSFSKIGTETSNREVGASASTSEIGVEVSNRTIGESASTSEIGVEVSNRTVGESASTSEIGVEVSNRTVGESASTSEIGVEVSNRTVGSSTSTSEIGIDISNKMCGEEISNSSIGSRTTYNNFALENSVDTVALKTQVETLASEVRTLSAASSDTLKTVGSETSATTIADANSVETKPGGVQATTDLRPTATTSGATVEIPETKVVM